MYEILPPSVQSRSPFSKIIEQTYSDLLFSLASGTGSLPYGLSPILTNEVDEEKKWLVYWSWRTRTLRHDFENGRCTGLIQPASSVPATSETLKCCPNVRSKMKANAMMNKTPLIWYVRLSRHKQTGSKRSHLYFKKLLQISVL